MGDPIEAGFAMLKVDAEVRAAALANVRRADNPPSGMRHDEMLKA